MNAVLKKVVKLSALLAITIFALPTQANTKNAELSYQPTLENQRNPNEYCAKCHKLDANDEQSGGDLHFGKFHGTHLSKTNPSTGKPITCVSCHGNISENHRRGVKDVMRFESDIFSDKQPMYSVQEQNQVCFSCHRPEKLREKLWAHDVHAMKLPCAACHTLHPEKDAMKGIEKKQRVKLCVDCHGEQQKRKALKDLDPTSKQKDNK
ncbi:MULTISPECIES: cytochrome c nitrite reductase pentaheme subunit [unclassified Avibacterium]|uniref:cytochrome c nitrite reductase pentaheme subunit n=1 Tax=unclassified Avibacterium TaxID=2685287 RepID=UPI0020260D4E|nr:MULTISPECIES: cytochrome c nitrite reductase pentaheme subunit [unclassified Avibacterium]URL02484.1 cytochrome c nitrite reductase pentaheme subunit [Avibacterium sp. 20-126]MCW9698620.1 cytochrome c nitrite reductase pentaheme subunit [Avibacterium sp. 20-129]MCW9717676.1 cytochrome c nitrite reductase pentaheme subunit [Avibacterium sp. 21-599]MCW9732432.1 cytochrome c nitrite reductase pentaheme subunit [Avibacterium sp. 20-15]URL04593.1 cytochrome c nitrite reductase pentaheme subunit 